jgi:hypothetical protein
MSRQQQKIKESEIAHGQEKEDIKGDRVEPKQPEQQYKEFTDQEVKDLLYKEAMDDMKKDLVWDEDAQMFFHENENGTFDSQFTVAELRKLAKADAEKQATPEFIKKFKEQNKKQTEIKRNIRNREANIVKYEQIVNSRLEANRQLDVDIKVGNDKIIQTKEQIYKLDKERLEHTKYIYKIQSKAIHDNNMLQQSRVENILAIERDKNLEKHRIDTMIQTEEQIDLQIRQVDQQQQQLEQQHQHHLDSMTQQANIHFDSMTQREQQHLDSMTQRDIISKDWLRAQDDIQKQQNEASNQLLRTINSQSKNITKGFEGRGTVLGKLGDGLAKGAADTADALSKIADAQGQAAKEAQDAAGKAQQPTPQPTQKPKLQPGSPPGEITKLCKGACPYSYSWREYTIGCRNKTNGETGITIWQCVGGGHFCASDKGPLPTMDDYGRHIINILQNYVGPDGNQLRS